MISIERTVCQSVVTLVRQCRVRDASVLIDIGCGLGAVAELVRDQGLTYIGFGVDTSGLADLEARGFEVEQVDLLDVDEALAAIRKKSASRGLAAIVMIDVLSHLSNGADLLGGLAQIASEPGGCPLILAVPNVTHLDIGATLLMGQWDVTGTGVPDATRVAFFSAEGLRRTTNESGWMQIASNDVVVPESGQCDPLRALPLQPGTPFHDLLASVRAQASEGAVVSEFVRAYEFHESNSEPSPDTRIPSPFLSVLMRTQGKREATIQEALLALAAQTSQNFEVFILAHDVSRDEIGNLRYLADGFGERFSARVRVIPVDGGGRSRPLNVGVDLAQGRYVAVLDDDDIVFGHWVATYERLADQACGRIIRCVPAEQSVRPMTWPGGREGYEITSRPRCPWPERFDLLDHLFENRTPPCSYAIPRSAFADLGIRFDEALPVLEDWDALLRIAALSGVEDTIEVTALWRKWDRGDSSTFVHSHSEWHKARRAVIAKLDAGPLLLPANSVTRIQELVAAQDRTRRIKRLIIWRLSFPIRTARRLRRRVLSRTN